MLPSNLNRVDWRTVLALLSNDDLQCGEKWLVIEILGSAIVDEYMDAKLNGYAPFTDKSMSYFWSDDFLCYCKCIGIDPRELRDRIQTALEYDGFLPRRTYFDGHKKLLDAVRDGTIDPPESVITEALKLSGDI